jgi:FG-GAP repeat
MKKIITATFILTTCVVKAQNVGIGILIPTEKLQVAGNIKTDTVKTNTVKITPNAGAGKILVSDAAGNGGWQDNNAAGSGSSVGYGSWGDCSVNSISEYNPVADIIGATGDIFGTSVSVNGDYAIIGSSADDVGANADQGSASIFQFNGTNWIFRQKIIDAFGAAGDLFGSSVAIAGNYAIVGASADDVGANTDQGSVSIYQLTGGNWVLQNKIFDASGSANDNFGNSVCIAGNYAAAAAKSDDVGANVNQGSVLTFQLSAGTWSLLNKFTDAGGLANDFFGASVAITTGYIIVGIEGDDVAANVNQGSANIYQLSGGSWVFMQKITDPFGLANDIFGNSVAIAGFSAVVGSYQDDVGANVNQGSALIFNLNAGTWALSQKITEPLGVANGFFGKSVAISGNYAIMGADGDGVTDYNAATIYTRIGIGWQRVQYFKDPGANRFDLFASSISVDGITKRFLIGVPAFASGAGKAVFGKIN